MAFINRAVLFRPKGYVGLDSRRPLFNITFNLWMSMIYLTWNENRKLTAVRIRAIDAVEIGLKWFGNIIPSSLLFLNHILFTAFCIIGWLYTPLRLPSSSERTWKPNLNYHLEIIKKRKIKIPRKRSPYCLSIPRQSSGSQQSPVCSVRCQSRKEPPQERPFCFLPHPGVASLEP